MKLPSMKYADGIGKVKQIKFGGLARSLGAGDGEIWDMQNMTSDHHPLLSSRRGRWKKGELVSPGGIFSWDGLCWVDGTTFYFDGAEKGTVSEGKKVFASMGAYVLIFPDKAYYNVDTGEFGSMEASWSGKGVVFSDGTLYGEAATANCISCEGVRWEDYFRSGDAVTITGCTVEANNVSLIIRQIDGDKLYFYENSFQLGTEEGEVQLRRKVPDLKYLCENENRLWGCTDNTIYACKLGDIFNWEVYDGLDTDAYSVDTGSAGPFTGCISYRGYPTFFKEDHIYKVYGSVPSNFEVLGSATLGLMDGCAGSLAVAGETLFYLSRSGMMAYTGGIPQPVNEAFGTERFYDAVAGSDGLKFYVSMKGGQGRYRLYVFDTQAGTWHIEDDIRITHFARADGELYMLSDDGTLWAVGLTDAPEGATVEDAVEWYVEFADFTEEDPNKKGVSKLQIRLELEQGAEAQAWLMFDSDGEWIRAGHALGQEAKRSYYLPIVPRRADHYRLKITGTGACRIHSIAREVYSGSELRSRSGRN
ncbi:MAG: hypothetical protein IJW45_08670 [Oscillospiraceae bacterium]|nr:hypothetical protein [Oscillospiraceae bacterium]